MSTLPLPPRAVVEKQSLGPGAHDTFDNLVASYRMPPPGPGYYRARRQLWLTPRRDRPQNQSQVQQPPSSQRKLEKLLQTPGAASSDSCWKNGIEKVWKGLSKGDRLKYRLPMGLIIKVVHASWVRDDTWPVDMQAPEPDDEIPEATNAELVVLERLDATIGSPELARTS